MKQILSIIFSFTSILALSQKMNNGIYHNIKKDRSFESDIFEFKENNKFNYILLTCTGTGLGAGTYNIKDDTIHLEFKEFTSLNNQAELKFGKADSDSISIKIKVLDIEGYELPAVNCILVDEKMNWQTDFNGDLNAKTLRKKGIRELLFSFIGFEDVNITIPEDVTEVNGTIRLGNFWLYGTNDNLSFKILSKKRSGFKLARYEEKNITYEKMKKSKQIEIVEDRTKIKFEKTFPE